MTSSRDWQSQADTSPHHMHRHTEMVSTTRGDVDCIIVKLRYADLHFAGNDLSLLSLDTEKILRFPAFL